VLPVYWWYSGSAAAVACQPASQRYARLLWGMFTGTYSLLGMAVSPGLVSQGVLELGQATWQAVTGPGWPSGR
jgi:hypothetical protein